jgi:hypothetical protein
MRLWRCATQTCPSQIFGLCGRDAVGLPVCLVGGRGRAERPRLKRRRLPAEPSYMAAPRHRVIVTPAGAPLTLIKAMPSRLNVSESFCSVPARGVVAPVSKSARVRTGTPLASANRSRDQSSNALAARHWAGDIAVIMRYLWILPHVLCSKDQAERGRTRRCAFGGQSSVGATRHDRYELRAVPRIATVATAAGASPAA